MLAQARTASSQPSTQLKGVPVPHEVTSRMPPLRSPQDRARRVRPCALPLRGARPRSGQPFLDVTDEDGRRGHRTARGVLWEDVSFSDRRALVYIPKGFDARRPGLIVVFLHGHRATLERDVQRPPEGRRPDREGQRQCRADCAAVRRQRQRLQRRPLLGVPTALRAFLGEAGAHLARLHGDKRTRKTFATLPVVVVAYSGGYVPAAWALHKGGTDKRVLGVLMLDALYGEVHKYADSIKHTNTFFVSAYTSSSAKGNEALQGLLADRDIPVASALPPRLVGNVAFLRTTGANHTDYVTRAWADDPIRDVLERMPGYARTPPSKRTDSRRDPLR